MLSRTATGAPASTRSPTGDGQRDDQRRGRRADRAALVLGDPVDDRVDLDQMGRGVGRGDHPVAHAVDLEPARVVAETFQRGLDLGAVHSHPVPVSVRPWRRRRCGSALVGRAGTPGRARAEPAAGRRGRRPGTATSPRARSRRRRRSRRRPARPRRPGGSPDRRGYVPGRSSRCRPTRGVPPSHLRAVRAGRRMNDLFVVPPSITTVVSSSARRSRARACSRVPP